MLKRDENSLKLFIPFSFVSFHFISLFVCLHIFIIFYHSLRLSCMYKFMLLMMINEKATVNKKNAIVHAMNCELESQKNNISVCIFFYYEKWTYEKKNMRSNTKDFRNNIFLHLQFKGRKIFKMHDINKILLTFWLDREEEWDTMWLWVSTNVHVHI